jgi:hypothetical protein
MAMGWQAKDVFRVFADRNMRPGDGIAPHVLVLAVGRSGQFVIDAVKELEGLGYVRVEQNETLIVLTNEGYEAISAGATV